MRELGVETSGCKCDILKSSEKQRVVVPKGNVGSGFMFLMTMEYPGKVFYNFLRVLKSKEYSLENSVFLNALGCSPKEYNVADSFKSFSKCKSWNVAPQIKKIKPKVIFTEGLALYSIVEETYLKYNHFFDYGLLKTYFWSDEFNCWVVPLPPLLDYIKKLESGSEELCSNFFHQFTNIQLSVGKSILDKKIRKVKRETITLDDPLPFLKELVSKPIDKIAIDTETDGLSYFKNNIISAQICTDGSTGYFFNWDNSKEIIALMIKVFEVSKTVIMANGVFDCKFFRNVGVYNARVDSDVNYKAHFIASNKGNSLKANTYMFTDYGGYENDLDRYKKQYKIKNYSYLPKDLLGKYAAMDVIASYQLDTIIDRYMNDRQRDLFYNTYIPLVNLMIEVEMKGVNIDLGYLKSYRESCEKQIVEIENKVRESIIELKKEKGSYKLKQLDENINLNSDKQVGEMFEKLGAKAYAKGKGGQFLTGEKFLLKWKMDGVPLVDYLLDHRRLSTLTKTFLSEDAEIFSNIDPRDNRVHASFKYQGTQVGRLACENPNLQNLPIKSDPLFRPIFRAKKGYYLVECDYAGFHLRLVTIFSKDPVLVELFQSDNKDMHSKTASIVFTKYSFNEFCDKLKNGSPEEKAMLKDYRNNSKKINFGLIYGMSYKKLAHDILMVPPPEGWDMGRVYSYLEQNNITNVNDYLGETSVRDESIKKTRCYEACAKSIREKFFNEYKGLFQWISKMHLDGEEKGYVDSMYGFRVWFPELSNKTYEGREVQYANLKNVSVNAPVISTEANIMQRAMVNIHKFLKENKYDAYIVNQVHDSVLLEIREDLMDELKHPIMDIMTKDYPEYEGIPIDAEAFYSHVWGGSKEDPWKFWFDSSLKI